MLIRKTFRFEAAHRLPNAFSERCRGIHGHSYKVELILGGQVKLKDSMVLDFGMVKRKFGRIIDDFDHSLILSHDDPLVNVHFNMDGFNIDDLNPRFIFVPYEPTAEMMAAHFKWFWEQQMGTPSAWVRVHETESGYAECQYEHLAIDYNQTFYSKAILKAQEEVTS